MWQAFGVFMEIYARNRYFKSSVEQRIAKERRDENIVATSEAYGHIIKFQEQIEDLSKQLGEMREEVTKAS